MTSPREYLLTFPNGLEANVFVDESGGNINTNFKEGSDDAAYDSAIDGLESLILAHACAGIDISKPKYREGIATALEAISNSA